MKRFLALALAALISFSAQATTYVPIPTLSPTGSTSGQVIKSTGPTTAPAWASVTFGILPTMAANTVLGNGTGTTASPAAIAMPSCSASGNNLQWTSGTGFTCATGYALTANPLSQFAATTSAQLLGVISDETGTGALVFGTSPTITTPNIVGTATNNNAAAGSVGEFPSPTNLTGVALTTSTAVNVASISLTAGDWDVSGVFTSVNTGGTVQAIAVGLNTTTGTLPAANTGASNVMSGISSGGSPTLSTPMLRVSVASTTTVFLVGSLTFVTGTATGSGFIRARRVR